jgi:5-methylcytosine-specific restriction enzyme subunit McrC
MIAHSRIPIENLYYLLAYAWDHFREVQEIDVASESCPDIHNLLARVLANGIRRLASRGMDKAIWRNLRKLQSCVDGC